MKRLPPSAAQLRAARAWLGWSAEEAGYRAGISYATVSRAERGEPGMRPSTLELLRAAYAAEGMRFVDREGLARVPSVQAAGVRAELDAE
jgi:transcriptional regulator with XRE-family HTH domain